MSSTAHAAVGTAVWAGGAPNLLWSTPANWQSGVVPSTGDDLEFPPGSFSLNDLPEGTSFRSMMLQGARIEGNPIQVTQQIAGAGVVATPITTGVGTLVVQGAVTFQAPIATHGAPVRIAIDFPNGPSYGPTFQGPISGPSALVIESDAIFNHSSSYAGGTTIQSGATVVVTATGGLGDPTTRVTVQGSLQIQPSADTTVLANPLTLVGTVGTAYASSPGTAALTGAIDAQGGSIGGAGLSEPPSLSVAGNITGSLNVDHAALSGVNSFPGGLTIGGIVDVASSGALGGLESTTTVEGNLRLLGNVNVDTHLVLHPTQTSIDTELQGTCGQTCGTATVRGTVQVDTPPQYVGIPRITAWSGEALTMASRLSGSGSLLIIGAADNPIALPTASLYSGPSLNVQNVRLQDALALGSPQAPVLAQGLSAADGLTVPTPLDLVELDNPAGTTTWTGPITTHGARLSAAAGTLRMTGNVSSKTDPNGAPALIQTSGAGTVEFANASTNNVDGGLSVTQGTTVLNEPPGVFAFTGPIAVFAGYSAPATLRLMHDSQLMPQSPVSLNQGGVLDLNGHQQALTSLTMNGGTVTTGAGTLHVNGDLPLGTSSSVLGNLDLGGVTRTLSGLSPSIVDASVVNGAAGVIVEGVLAFGSHARSLYTGPTEVRSSSRADVEGDLSTSPLLVDAHAHLTGSGVVGPATVNGEIANSRGTGALPMSIRGALTMGGTGGLSAYIPQHRNGCGMCAILLNAGSVDLSAHPTLAVDTGVGARAGERFTIVNNSGNAPVLGTFANLPEGGEIDQPDGTRFTISYAAGDGNDIVLTVIQNTTETSMVYGNGGPATVGQPTVIHAAAAGPIGIPSGTVTFFVPGQQPAAVSLDANGQASVTTVFNSSGSQVSVPIRYSGDAWHPAAWGTLTEIVVRPTPRRAPSASTAPR